MPERRGTISTAGNGDRLGFKTEGVTVVMNRFFADAATGVEYPLHTNRCHRVIAARRTGTVGSVLLVAIVVAGAGCQPQTRQGAEIVKKLEAIEKRLAAIETHLGSTSTSDALAAGQEARFKPGEAPAITLITPRTTSA